MPYVELLSRVLTILALILINAFFVAAEFSVVSARRTRVSQLVREGDLQAISVQKLHRDIDQLLSTTQIGITLSSLALGWIGERAIATWVGQSLAAGPLPAWLGVTIALPLSFLAIAYFQIVLGELFPKTIALIYAERLAKVLGPISLSIANLFQPITWILNASNRLLLKLWRVEPSPYAIALPMTADEIQLLLETASEASDLQEEDREILRNVFESGEVSVNEVMTPRTNIHAVSSTSTLQEFLQEVAQTGHDFYPVIDDSLDQVRGVIHGKDVLRHFAEAPIMLEQPIQSFLQTAWFVDEETPIRDVLNTMQRYNLKFMMVRESGFDGTAGLVTLQDLLRRTIGLEDESVDEQGRQISPQGVATYQIDAQTDLEAVNEELGATFPLTDAYQTLGGFILYLAQKMPDEGEQFTYQNFELRVAKKTGPRLEQILVRRLAKHSG